MTDRFVCGSRVEQGRFNPKVDATPDRWRDEKDGSKTCSYCGSMREQDFIERAEKYAAGEPGYEFDPSTKDYKWYAHGPGVRNAMDGAIKFYNWHVDRSDPKKLTAASAVVYAAVKRANEVMAATMQRRAAGARLDS